MSEIYHKGDGLDVTTEQHAPLTQLGFVHKQVKSTKVASYMNGRLRLERRYDHYGTWYLMVCPVQYPLMSGNFDAVVGVLKGYLAARDFAIECAPDRKDVLIGGFDG